MVMKSLNEFLEESNPLLEGFKVKGLKPKAVWTQHSVSKGFMNAQTAHDSVVKQLRTSDLYDHTYLPDKDGGENFAGGSFTFNPKGKATGADRQKMRYTYRLNTVEEKPSKILGLFEPEAGVRQFKTSVQKIKLY